MQDQGTSLLQVTNQSLTPDNRLRRCRLLVQTGRLRRLPFVRLCHGIEALVAKQNTEAKMTWPQAAHGTND